VNCLLPLPWKNGKLFLAGALGLLTTLACSLEARTDNSRFVRVNVKLPGLVEPLPVSVTSAGEATVIEYPKHWSGTLETVAFASPFGQKLDGALCEGVSSRVRMFVDPSIPAMMKDRIRESLRKDSSVTLHASSVSFLHTQVLQRAILDAAKAAGLTLNAVTVTNPLDASSYEVALSLTDRALSKALGEEEDLRAQLFALFGAGTLLTGETAGEFSAVDLACDLRSGEAKLSLRIKGSVGGGAAGRNLLTEVTARELVKRLDGRKGEFHPGDSVLDARRNAFVAGMVLGDELRTVKAQGLTTNDRIALFERLFSLSSGRPIALSGEALARAVRVPSVGVAPYSGTADFSLVSSGETP